MPLAWRLLTESHGPADKLDIRGLALAGPGLLGITFGIVRATALGWTSVNVITSIGLGVVLVLAFIAWSCGPRPDAADALLPLAWVLGRKRRLVRHVLRRGARVRPLGERRAELRAPAGGTPGIRRDERDPRARRRDGRRGAGVRVSANGSYASPQAFTDGVVAALPVAAVVLAIGALIALSVPGKPRAAVAHA